MGKTMEKLEALRRQRDLLTALEQRINTLYGSQISGLSAELNLFHRMKEIERINLEISKLEESAQKEQEQEIKE